MLISRGLPQLLFIVAGLLPVGVSADEQKVFKWTGADGVTYFSETPPAAVAGRVEVLELPEAPRAGVHWGPQPVDDYRQILELASILQADRLAREQARLERRAQRLRERELRLEAQRLEEDAGRSAQVWVPWYGPPRQRPGHRPHRRHQRPPPGAHPGYGHGRGDPHAGQRHRSPPLQSRIRQAQ